MKLTGVIGQYPKGTTFIIEWENGMKLKVQLSKVLAGNVPKDGGSDREYMACSLKIVEIIASCPFSNLQPGSQIEIYDFSPLLKVLLEDETLIWANEKCL